MPEDLSSNTSKRYSTETLMPQVYDTLRELAAHRMKQQPGHSISGTELVHEVYLRLNREGAGPRWANRSHFYGAAAEAMRRILIDRIRAKQSIKRGGGRQRVGMDQVDPIMPTDEEKLIEINAALEALADSDAQCADLIKMRFFAGMTVEQIAEGLGVSTRTVTRQWAYARGRLMEYLDEDGPTRSAQPSKSDG